MDTPPLQQNTGHTLAPGNRPPPTLAPGFQAIVGACQRLYPEQKNPLQISTVVKYWLGGPDPLDYITVYSNQGNCTHWHYVSSGLSDLHGDGRVHPPAAGPNSPSGYGFELTFRLRRRDELVPPDWPFKVLQKIAKYVFETENKLVSGDHITWSEPLGTSQSILKHLIVAEDPQLEVINTALGQLRFLQIFCVTEDELKAVQRWNGPGVISLLRNSPVGGSLLVTDIQRSLSLFAYSPETKSMVDAGIAAEGSNLCGMAACISWTETDVTASRERELTGDSALSDWASLAQQCDRLIYSGLNSRRVSYPRGVALACSLETARYLPLCIQGRLKHGFHFTLKSILKETAVTFVTGRVAGTLVGPGKHFAAQGDWLQVLIPEQFLDQFQERITVVDSELQLPHTFQFPEIKLSISVLSDTAQVGVV
ncbi:suppressor of fused homolog [Eurytemora carolleeae]|uniref:suppressor of fused homolog n=1 Tax=Eurytemora carolleeae TaxID=1294199 RepID=UPI000C767E30|nr:suppressor of fused homolog [Eurytemora carolleeae]|eukprot:XP_023345892.1 suppressor of fused homolog [Eurytemora affinis]